MVIESHYHGQFTVQLTHYLPLKEAVWYMITIYMGIYVASISRLQAWYERAALAGLLAILQDMTYEMSNAREGLGLVWINPDCELANLSEKVKWKEHMVSPPSLYRSTMALL